MITQAKKQLNKNQVSIFNKNKAKNNNQDEIPAPSLIGLYSNKTCISGYGTAKGDLLMVTNDDGVLIGTGVVGNAYKTIIMPIKDQPEGTIIHVYESNGEIMSPAATRKVARNGDPEYKFININNFSLAHDYFLTGKAQLTKSNPTVHGGVYINGKWVASVEHDSNYKGTFQAAINQSVLYTP